MIEDGVVALKPVRYDVDKTVDGLRQMPLTPAIRERLTSLLRHGRE